MSLSYLKETQIKKYTQDTIDNIYPAFNDLLPHSTQIKFTLTPKVQLSINKIIENKT